jgi:hypothetical protein
MSRRSSCLTADELKQIAAIKFSEVVPSTPGPDQKRTLRPANFNEIDGYLASKELEPPK